MNRRDFLKLLGIAPALLVNWPSMGPIVDFVETGVGDEQLPNILVLVLDALSARHMSLYGYRRQTTPQIDHAARKATVFHRHYAGGNYTTPGTASLLTGAYPWSHRALHHHGVVNSTFKDLQVFSQLSDQYNTFAYSHNPFVNNLFHQFRHDIDQWTRLSDLCLRSHSYADKYFQDDFNTAYDGELLLFRNLNAPSSSFFLSRFERVKRYLSEAAINLDYGDLFPRGVPNLEDEQRPSFITFTLEQAVDWIRDQFELQTSPFMGYVHLIPPHAPYTTRADFIDYFDDGWQPAAKPEHFFTEGQPHEYLVHQRRLYDEYIAYVDAEFGRLFAALEQEGALDNTLIMLTSDHGELFERGIYTHVTPTLYEPLIHIPLVVWSPNQDESRDVYEVTNCVDVLPTLLHNTGQTIPNWCEGQILPTFGGQAKDKERSVFAVEAKENPMYGPLEKATVAMIKGRYKLIHYFGYQGYEDEYEFYDLDQDPEELVNLYSDKDPQSQALRDELLAKLQ